MAKVKRKTLITEDNEVIIYGTDWDSHYVHILAPWKDNFLWSTHVPHTETDRKRSMKELDFLLEAFQSQKKWLETVKLEGEE